MPKGKEYKYFDFPVNDARGRTQYQAGGKKEKTRAEKYAEAYGESKYFKSKDKKKDSMADRVKKTITPKEQAKKHDATILKPGDEGYKTRDEALKEIKDIGKGIKKKKPSPLNPDYRPSPLKPKPKPIVKKEAKVKPKIKVKAKASPKAKSMYSKYADKKKVAPVRKPKLKESTYKAPKKKSWWDKFKPMSVKEYEATQPERKARRKAQQERRIAKRKAAVKKVKKSFKESREYKSLSMEELRKRTKKPKKRNINKQR